MREVLREFDEDGREAIGAHWRIAKGGNDLDFELYRDGEAVIQCIAGKLENISHTSLQEDEFKRISGVIKEEYPDVSIGKAVLQEKEEDFGPFVDWRGFTEQDFENLQADKTNDPDHKFNRDFYAGDLKLHIEDDLQPYGYQGKNITLWYLDNGGTLKASPRNILGTSLALNMSEVKEMTYEEFQNKVESHLRYQISANKPLASDAKNVLEENMEKTSPKNWAYAHLYGLTMLSKELIRNEDKTLADIEKEWVKPNNRKNVLLHGSSKNLMKKLKANLEKDKDIKNLMSRPTGR